MIKKITLLACLMGSMLGFAQLALPIDFESTTVTYTFTDFDGGQATVISNPQSNGINTSANVTQMVKNAGQPWGGSLLTLANPIDFSVNRLFKVKVYAPSAGARLLLKVENAANGGIFFEKEAMVTSANTWEELSFDFSAINQSNQYSKLVFIFENGTMGDGSANFTYLFDDIELVSAGGSNLSQIDLPVTFEDTTVDYSLTDFGGNVSSLVTDPAGGMNTVVRTVKTPGSMTWAGTTMGPASGTGFANAVPFTATETKMTVRVYSPNTGIPIRLKVEDASNATISVETEAMTTVANAWETLEFDFSNQATGTAALNLANTYNKASIFFYFDTDGAGVGNDSLYYWDDVKFVTGSGSGLSQIDLPVTFEDTTVDYSLTDFGGNSSSLVDDPDGGMNTVARSVKTPAAMTWAGTTMGPATGTGFANAIPFSATATKMTVRVYSPNTGIPIRLKVEDATNGAISVETEDSTTLANAWETLEFDFSNEVANTAALNLANTYDKASIFFHFGTDGANVGADSVYYWDDVTFVADTSTSGTSPYCMTEVQHLGIPAEVNSAIYLTIANNGPNSMYVEIESANSDSVDLLLIANGSGAMISDPDTSVAGKIRRTLTWTTAPDSVTLNVLWSKDSFGGNWQLSPMDITLSTSATCGDMGPQLSQIDLPVTFEDSIVDYSLTDFGGNASSLVADPDGGMNTVAKSIKTSGAELWAGTTMGPASGTGFANAVPFTASETKMTVRVYSPNTGIPIRLKVEDATNATISVETEDTTTVANAWETLEFDFSNEVMGTAALDLNNTYDKASIFFHFGTTGAGVGNDSVYYWDDVQFVMAPALAQIDLPVTFEDSTVDYSLTDFGGNSSSLVDDPDGGMNTVAKSIKTSGAELWAGTTMGPASGTGFANAVPFTASETKMTVRVYSPNTGIPIRLKVEDASNATISVETEDTTTVANAWETLEFDFSNHVMGTSTLDLNNTYDKASIFFHFGTTGADVGNDSVYYWDDVQFVMAPALAQIDLPVTFEDSTVDYSLSDFGGNASSLVTDPDGGMNTVARSHKTNMAELWAGTTMGPPSGTGFATAIPFSMTETKMNVRVYSPSAGIPIRLKVEDATNATISVETEDTTTVANAWETLEFDFSNHVMGTSALDLNNTYDKASIFFHFGTEGANVGADSVYYWDDVKFGPATTGIEDLKELGLKYYPNPTQNFLQLRADGRIGTIKVLNLMGQQMMYQTPEAYETRLDLSGLPHGIYLIEITINNHQGTIKVLKN